MPKNFVLHRHIRLAPHVVAELGLDHGKRGLGIRPLMVMLQELLALELVE
jgi:hypothetical protein